jgi:hypothetical protein
MKVREQLENYYNLVYAMKSLNMKMMIITTTSILKIDTENYDPFERIHINL